MVKMQGGPCRCKADSEAFVKTENCGCKETNFNLGN